MEQLSGIIHVMGEHDVGKTTFALECGAAPEKICFFDDDVKGRSTVDELKQQGVPFGRYIDLYEIAKGKTEVGIFESVMEEIQKIKPGEFDAIVFDTWTNFASCTRSIILRSPQKFRQYWSPQPIMKSGEEYREARRLEAEVINHLTSLATTVVLVTHLKDFYFNKAKVPGKFEPACTKVLAQVPRLRIWLRHNPGSGVPIGLVLKRLSKKHLVDGRIRTLDVLPRKITPRPGDASLWDTIAWYWDNPIGDRPPNPEETPDDYELSILDSTLTTDQKVILHDMIKAGVVEKEEEAAVTASMIDNDDLIERARGLLTQKKSVPAIAKEMGLSVAEVQALLKHEEVAFT